MRRRSESGEAGFIITLELILIFTILGLGMMVGIVAIRNALVKFFIHKQAAEILVVDSDPAGPKVIGKAFDLDEHEAPRLQFVDQGVDFGGIAANRRFVLGVRDDRFTSRHRIFYEGSQDCGLTDSFATACIVNNGNEDGDNLGVGIVPISIFDSDGITELTGSAQIQEAGGIGYLYPMQAGPAYGIGRDLDSGTGFPGTLFRETDAFCDPADVRSVWTSQTVISGEPCVALDAGVTVVAAKCPPGAGGSAQGDPCDSPPADSRCVTDGALQCGCPTGWVDFGANCCPPGTTEATPGQCTIGNTGAFRVAEPVLNGNGDNALSVYVAPFGISLPVENDATFLATAPGGSEGAPPGPVIGPADIDSIDYNTPPANGESGPP